MKLTFGYSSCYSVGFRPRTNTLGNGIDGGFVQRIPPGDSCGFLRRWRPKSLSNFLKEFLYLLLTLAFHNGSLPQGAPTSPFLLNCSLWFSGMVARFTTLSGEMWWLMTAEQKKDFPEWMQWFFWRRFLFTAYADDLTFSSPRSFGEMPFAERGDMRTVKGMIISAIESNGLYRINAEKTRDFSRKKEYPLIAGIRITWKRVGLPKKEIRRLRSFVHHANQSQDPKVQAQLQGWRAYLQMIYGESIPKQLAGI